MVSNKDFFLAGFNIDWWIVHFTHCKIKKKKLMESRKNITKVVYKHTTSTKITKNIFKSKKREKKITIKNILTEDNLKKKGWQGEENCVFCNELETVDHLFINCSVSQQL
jgi:zinc-binding in reverse transcriptase